MQSWPLKKFVEVTWEDITSHSNGWNSIDTYLKNTTAIKCKSAGYLVEKTKDYIKLTMSQCSDLEEASIGMLKIIPMGCVKKVKRLH